MNERIRELAEQAGILTEVWHKDSLGNGYKVPNYEAEKFAQLIVKECAGIDFRHKVGMTTDQEFDTGRVILEHFGVQE